MTTSTPSIFNPGNLPPYITIARAAELLDASVDTIRRMKARGEIRARKFGPRTLRIETASLFPELAGSSSKPE